MAINGPLATAVSQTPFNEKDFYFIFFYESNTHDDYEEE